MGYTIDKDFIRVAYYNAMFPNVEGIKFPSTNGFFEKDSELFTFSDGSEIQFQCMNKYKPIKLAKEDMDYGSL